MLFCRLGALGVDYADLTPDFQNAIQCAVAAKFARMIPQHRTNDTTRSVKCVDWFCWNGRACGESASGCQDCTAKWDHVKIEFNRPTRRREHNSFVSFSIHCLDNGLTMMHIVTHMLPDWLLWVSSGIHSPQV